ncbi:site-specific recombinase XerD [Chitinophaga japonensis]|uniref:Site-specific recombinase XerD n=2 Tax=Chitinophaga japonensis TaxID=104662 RepID=A0A562SPF2_CHIJA|nr:site-specific recombinase XerD [Chitinophaga japonensis]
MPVSLSIELDTRRMKKRTGAYPVKLLVVHDSVPQRYQTIYDLSKEDFKKLSAPRLSSDLQKARDSLKDMLRSAETAAKEIRPFAFNEFERYFITANPLFKPRKQKQQNVEANSGEFDFSPYEGKFPILKESHPRADCISVVFAWYVKNLIKEGRIGSALNYQNTYYSLKKFQGNAQFVDVTPGYLRQYEKWMRDRNCSKSTVGINLRPLRSIYNLAIDEFNLIPRKNYPFGRRKYLIPTSKNIKKALAQDDISKIYYYDTDNIEYSQARDYWLFFFFANGMNPKDAALLRYRNIQGEFIVFERAKTQLTTRNDPKPITVYITEDIQAIIDRWGNKDKSPTNYIFPILQLGMTPLEEHYAIKAFVKFVNDRMAKICEELNIRKATTIYTRHTYSTFMKRSGASTEFIQEALGHADKSTTENYLDSFEKDVKKEFAGKLISFKKTTPPEKIEVAEVAVKVS